MIIIPVHNMSVLPDTKIYFRKEHLSEAGLNKLSAGERVTFVLTKSPSSYPTALGIQDLYPIGVTGVILGVDEEGGANIELESRINLEHIDFPTGNVIGVSRPEIQDYPAQEAAAKLSELKEAMLNYVTKFQWGLVARGYVLAWKNLNEVMVGLSPFMNITPDQKYAVLGEDSQAKRAQLIEQFVREFMAIYEVREEAKQAQQETHERAYREDAIKKQINFLQKQLDDLHPENVSDVRKFEEKIKQSGMNEEARKEAENVLNRMKQEGKDSHEYGLLYNYLDFLTSLKWTKEEPKEIDLSKAEEILDEEHYGLKKVKKRIIEQLAVMSLNKQQSGSILLFAGAPGTGKTSIGKSIAQALSREYVRISLGGVRDEADIRGHRRTYIGAMPGRIMDGMKKAGTSNPVMVLDEIDKLASSYNGDPASALLEVLDPEQNNTFTDHYMNVPYDLSDVLFICTANTVDTIPSPLLNRMELIQFQGYTPTEKFEIAKRHLLPKALSSVGLTEENVELTEDALRTIISDYTREGGVRGLKKRMDTLCRIAAVRSVRGQGEKIRVEKSELRDFLDMHPLNHREVKDEGKPGVVTGLAWTAVGGEILYVETLPTKGDGKITITGQLGDVMKESAQIAVSLVKSMFPDRISVFKENDIHIHVPDGSTPKDGPSAGITLTTAIASLVTGHAVTPRIAMTGEVSLEGDVNPIGGLPEKLMAAQRAGVRKVLLPKDNVDDLRDVPEEVREKLEIVPVETVEEVLKLTGIKSAAAAQA